MKYFYGIILTLSFFGCKPNSDTLPIQVARAYGVEHFEKITSLEFVFHVQKGEKLVATRHWKWFPKSKKVEYIDALSASNDVFCYNRSASLSEKDKAVDAKFINDTYWLLFPLHLLWDKEHYLSLITENVPAPISKKNTTQLTIQFNNADGYTPDDAYDLYLDGDRIIEWTYRKGGQKEATKTTTWTDVIELKGLKIATQHQSANGDFKLWFDGIVVE